MLIGGIEAGGTKMVCAVGDENGVIKDRVSFPTRQPKETFEDMIGYYKNWDISSLGIGCFGPLDLNKASDTYGYITKTPKKGWEYCDVVGTFREALNVPVGFDTDVNGAVLGEVTWGAAKGAESAIYIRYRCWRGRLCERRPASWPGSSGRRPYYDRAASE